MKIKQFEFKNVYSQEEVIEIDKVFKEVSRPGVDYSEAGIEYKVGYIKSKVNRLAYGLPLHDEVSKWVIENSFVLKMFKTNIQ